AAALAGGDAEDHRPMEQAEQEEEPRHDAAIDVDDEREPGSEVLGRRLFLGRHEIRVLIAPGIAGRDRGGLLPGRPERQRHCGRAPAAGPVLDCTPTRMETMTRQRPSPEADPATRPDMDAILGG